MATPSFLTRAADSNFSATGKCGPLRAPCCNQRTLRLIGVDVDEADSNAREGLAALHADGVGQHAAAVGKMTAIASRKRADDLDILYGIVIVVSQRERHQRLRTEAAATPGLR